MVRGDGRERKDEWKEKHQGILCYGIMCDERCQVDCTHLPSFQPRLFFGDSWFRSGKAACQVRKLGHHGCFVIKTVHSRTPKKFLEEKNQHFPGGTWIVMEGYAENEGIPLICIWYEYNVKKVLAFITTKGVGSTQRGNLEMYAQERLHGQKSFQTIYKV